MLDLMPKISERLDQIGGVDEYIRKYKKLEIQYFPREAKPHMIDYETPLKQYLEKFELEEVTFHTPLQNFDIEWVLMCNEDILKYELKSCVEMSKKYNLNINLLYHTHWNMVMHRAATINKIKDCLKIIDDTNVNLLVENLIMISENNNETTALELCEEINHPNFKMCFDICHMYTQSHMYGVPAEEWFANKLNKELCEKYVKQVHFSYTANNDGYRDKKNTHGIGHFSKESVEYDVSMLEKFGMKFKTIVTEIAEENYSFRGRQLKDIEWLEELYNNK